MEIVDHHDVDASVERCFIGPHVGFERGARVKRPVGALDRNVHLRECRDRLRLAVLEDLEVLFLEVLYQVAFAVGHHNVDFHIVDAQFERGRLRLRGLCRLCRLVGNERGCGRGEKRHERRELYAFFHKGQLSRRL